MEKLDIKKIYDNPAEFENKLVKDIKWPPHTLLVDIKRGEEQLVPAGDTKIMAGDFIYVLSHNEHVVLLQKLAAEKEEE